MPDVVLLYEGTCPNVREARGNLLRAFSGAKTPASWREVDLEAADTPDAWRAYGSPTILVDGRDVGGAAPATGATCRLYEVDGRLARAPSVERIVAGLRSEPIAPPARVDAVARKSVLAAAPGVAIALLPKVFCPACWPAYAAALSAVGLGFLMQERYLLPITIAALGLATLGIAHRARQRRGFAPVVVAAVGAVGLVVSKFFFDSTLATYAATALFAGAAIWNAWPLRRATTCAACISEAPTQTV
jgi:mercuric ion transport protein